MSSDQVNGVAGSSTHRWYALALLFAAYLSATIDRSAISVIIEPLKREFGWSDARIGLLGGFAFSTSYAIAVLPMGWLVDRINRRKFLAAIVVVWSLLTLSCAAAVNFFTLALARFGVGAAEAGAQPTSFSLIADIFPLRQRSTAASIYFTGATVGQLVVFILGGVVLLHFGWRSVFLLAGIPGLFIAGLIYFTLREPARGGQGAPSAQSSDRRQGGEPGPFGFRAIARSPALMHAIAANMLSSGVQYTLVVWMVSFLVRLHGLSNHVAAIYVGLGLGLVPTVGALLGGLFADRMSRGDPARLALMPAAGTLGAFVAAYVMILAPSTGMAITALSILALCSGFFGGTSYSLLLTLAPVDLRGSALALAKLVTVLIGNSVFPYLAGLISDASHSLRPALLFTVTFYLWALVHYLLASRAAKRVVKGEEVFS